MAVGGSLRAEIERAQAGLPARLPGASSRGGQASGQGTGQAGGIKAAGAVGARRAMEAAIERFLDQIFGPHGNQAEFVAPEGDALYQDLMIRGYSLGLGKAAGGLGLGTPAPYPDRNGPAVRNLITSGFERLSDQGRIRLGDRIIDQTSSVLADGLRAGMNPIDLGQQLSDQFDAYKRWEFDRLARTELAFSHTKGIADEYAAEGVQRHPETEEPPYHPNCTCSLTTDENGLVVPDVSSTACEICQAMRVR